MRNPSDLPEINDHSGVTNKSRGGVNPLMCIQRYLRTRKASIPLLQATFGQQHKTRRYLLSTAAITSENNVSGRVNIHECTR
jgi:hypothetical protein